MKKKILLAYSPMALTLDGVNAVLYQSKLTVQSDARISCPAEDEIVITDGKDMYTRKDIGIADLGPIGVVQVKNGAELIVETRSNISESLQVFLDRGEVYVEAVSNTPPIEHLGIFVDSNSTWFYNVTMLDTTRGASTVNFSVQCNAPLKRLKSKKKKTPTSQT